MLTHTSEHRMLAATAAAMPRVSERLRIFLRTPEASPEALSAFEQMLVQNGVPDAQRQKIMAETRAQLAANTARENAAASPRSPARANPGLQARDDDESEEHAAERIASGRTFQQQADQAHISEAAMIGAGLGVLPAAAYLSQTIPSLYALGGSAALGSLLTLGAPVAGGMALGHHLGKRWGHPMMGTLAGTVSGTALGYGALQAAPLLPALNATLTGWGTTLGGIGYWSTLPLAAGGGALGYFLGKNMISGDHGGTIGAGIGTVAGAGLGAAATWSGVLGTVAPYIPTSLGFVALPGAVGAYFGNKIIGGKTGGVIGGVAGAAMGASMWGLSTSGLAGVAAGTSPGWFPVLAGAAVPAAAVGALYLGGKVHQLVWGTPQNVGTWGMLGRAVASPITLPARALNFAHELAWGTDKAEDLGTQTLRTIASPLTVPAGLLWKRLGLGALAEGVWNGMDEGYQPQHSGIYGALEWIGSRPGQLLRGIGSAVSSIPAKGKGLMNWLFEKKSS